MEAPEMGIRGERGLKDYIFLAAAKAYFDTRIVSYGNVSLPMRCGLLSIPMLRRTLWFLQVC